MNQHEHIFQVNCKQDFGKSIIEELQVLKAQNTLLKIGVSI